jgi:glycyl-tRNA synthetase beta chain
MVSLADKIDSIAGAVGVGLAVSGSSDPFGLRRSAHGVCAIVIEKKLDISLTLLLDKVLKVLGDKLLRPRAEVKAACLEFFEGRLRYIFETRGFRYDLVEAALGPGIDRIAHSFQRVKALDGLRSSPDFEPFILMAKRINNILKEVPACRLNPDLFVEKEERELHSMLVIIRKNAGPMIEKGDFARAQSIILRLRPALNAFFDKVLVMAEDKRVRQNRLGLLQAIRKLLLEIADYSRVVVEGEKTGKTGNAR